MCGNFFVNYITVHLDRTSLTTLMFNILKGNKTWPISTAFDQWPTVNFDFSFPQDFPKAGGLAWCKKCWKGWSPCSKQLFLGFSGEIMRRSTAQTHPLMKCIGGWETWHSSHPQHCKQHITTRMFENIQGYPMAKSCCRKCWSQESDDASFVRCVLQKKLEKAWRSSNQSGRRWFLPIMSAERNWLLVVTGWTRWNEIDNFRWFISNAIYMEREAF